jgi:hypothetical protein
MVLVIEVKGPTDHNKSIDLLLQSGVVENDKQGRDNRGLIPFANRSDDLSQAVSDNEPRVRVINPKDRRKESGSCAEEKV